MFETREASIGMRINKHRKIKKLVLLVFPLLLWDSVLLLPSFASVAIKPMFSIIWITDTQYLSYKIPDNFDTMCNWIATYSETLNVKAVLHTGDIVERAWNKREWARADNSMSILLKANIPYCWDAGNHDQLGTSWVGKDFPAFDTAIMRKKDYWVGDILEGKNTAIEFTASNWNFLILNIENHANDSVLDWANDLLRAHPNSHTIVATHSYISDICAYDDWARHFRSYVLNKHPNIFMTLNGHFMQGSRANRTYINNRHELFFNCQHTNGGEGDATIRILTFSKEEDAILVNTFNTVTNQFLSDPENRFTLDIPFFKNPDAPESLTLTRNKPIEVPEFSSISSEVPEFSSISSEVLEIPFISFILSILVFSMVPLALLKSKLEKTKLLRQK